MNAHPSQPDGCSATDRDLTNYQIVVSLTTISSRIDTCHRVVERLLDQRAADPYAVVLNISREPYLLDKGIEVVPDSLRRLQAIHPNFKIWQVPNTGPYRKLLPVLAEIRAQGSDPVIVTCDDDVDYPQDFLARLVAAHQRHGGIVANRGYTMQSAPSGAMKPYREWQVAAKDRFTIRNFPTGKDGILYRSSHFHDDVLDESAAVTLAPTADDFWFRWHTILKSVPVELADVKAAADLPSVEGLDASKTLYAQYNAKGGNDQTCQVLESHFHRRYGAAVGRIVSRQAELEEVCQTRYNSESLGAIRSGAERRIAAIYWADSVRWYKNPTALPTSPTAREARQTLFAQRSRLGAETPFAGTRGGFSYARRRVEEYEVLYGWMSRDRPDLARTAVTVVMTSHNASETVEWAVESVLRQDHPNLEVVVVDDASTDDTPRILRALQRKHENVRAYLMPVNRGTYFGKNFGLMHARGDVIAFQDSDDYSHPSRIRLQLARLHDSGRVAVRCAYVRHDPVRGVMLPINGSPQQLGYITLMFRRQLIDEIGYFDCARKAADDEFIRRLKRKFGPAAIDDFDLPAYVALYQPNSLIADSTIVDESGIRFRLAEDRDRYLKAFEAFHERLFAEGDGRIADRYQFPPRSINFPKPDSLTAIREHELEAVPSELAFALFRSTQAEHACEHAR